MKSFDKSYSLSNEIDKLEIPQKIKECLQNVNIKIALPKKTGERKNNRLNIYIRDAEDQGGKQRICYLAIEDSCIEVTEFKGSRGDRYSGFYKILLRLLKESNINYNKSDNKLIFDIEDWTDLLQIFNEINTIYKKGDCVLKNTGDKYSKKIGGEECEYPIQYYVISSEEAIKDDKESIFMKEIKKEIDEHCKILIEGSGDQFLCAYEELQRISYYISGRLNENKERKEALEKVRGIKLL